MKKSDINATVIDSVVERSWVATRYISQVFDAAQYYAHQHSKVGLMNYTMKEEQFVPLKKAT